MNIFPLRFQDELDVYEAGESFVQSLIMNLETLLSSFKDILTPSNYDCFTQVLTAEVTQRFEKVILKSTFNRVGFTSNLKREHLTLLKLSFFFFFFFS